MISKPGKSCDSPLTTSFFYILIFRVINASTRNSRSPYSSSHNLINIG